MDLQTKPHLETPFKLGPETNDIEIVAENHRGRRFYKNWIVHGRLHHCATKNPGFTCELVDGPGEGNPAHPEIEVLSPVGPREFRRGEAKISVTVDAVVTTIGQPLASVGVDEREELLAAGTLEARIERRLTVPTTRSEVQVWAADVRGNTTRVRIPIRKAGAAPPPRLSGSSYLLSIGISEHQSAQAGLPYLPGAAAAAGDLPRLLVDRLELEKKEIGKPATLVLRDRDATLARVKSALRDFASRPGPDDLLIVYFASYGFHGRGPDVDRTFLGCWDTRLDQLSETALGVDELGGLLGDTERVRARQVVLLFEPRRVPDLDLALDGSNLINTHLLRLCSKEQGRTVLVSADVGQDSLSRPAQNGVQGVFASAVMQGLEGEADGNRDRILEVRELFDFVVKRVRAESEGTQMPRYCIADRARALGPVASR